MALPGDHRGLRRRRLGGIGVSIAMALTIVGQLLGPARSWSVVVVVAAACLLVWCARDAIRAHRRLQLLSA